MLSRPLLVLLAASTAACTPAPEVSWHGEVRPMVESQCVRCHAGAGPGIGDFRSLDEVRTFSDRMIARMEEGTMPPAAADPDCRDYTSSEHVTVSDADVALFRKWLELEAPEGREADYVAPTPPNTTLADPDLTLTMPSAYTPTFGDEANPGNEYRCFILDHDRTEDFYITALNPVVDNAALVHHIVLYAVTMDEMPEGYDPAVGVDCIDGRGDIDVEGDPINDGMVTGWAPGMLPIEYDVGGPVKGLRVAPDQKIIAQMHYFLPGPEFAGQSDQSGFAFRTRPESEVDVRLRMANLGTDGRSIQIPANSTWTYEWEYEVEALAAGTIHTTFPHMHKFGVGWNLEIEHADGSRTCVSRGDNWDFDNQLSYELREPVRVDAGDTIKLSCDYDNPTDQVITGGERTDEEMCFVFIQAQLDLLNP